MKSSWKGSLSFGLVTIPVELYSAVQEHSLGFKLLHASCHTPINYERWCKHCKKEVQWNDIVKGIKLKNQSYFILTPEAIKKIKPETTNVINILACVDTAALDIIYLDQHYYVLPAKEEAGKAYFLFIAALASLHKVAIGQFVMKDKEHVCAIQPHHDGLLLTTLNYAYEIKESPKPRVTVPKIAKQELALAEQLIKKLSKKKLDMNAFKDTFAEKLRKKLQTTKKGKKILAQPRKKKIIMHPSLVESLQASLSKHTSAELRKNR